MTCDFFVLICHVFRELMIFLSIKNLEMSNKMFKFANDNLLLTIGG